MSRKDSAVGMMDAAYFVGKRILLEWINDLLALDLKKIEQTCTGAIACQILQSIFPGKVPMSKVDFGAKHDYEYIKNYKVLQNSFDKLKISKHIPVDKLVRGKYQDNLEFMQWFKSFYDSKGGAAEDYNPVEARARSRNAPKGVTASSSSKASASRSAPARTKRTTKARTAKAGIKETTKENSVSSSRPVKKAPASSSTSQLREANEKLVRQVAAMKLEVEALRKDALAKEKENEEETEIKMALDGLEKERDFYFKKLRDIEVYLQELGEPESDQAKEISQKVFAILYATDDEDFEIPAADAIDKVDVTESPSKLPNATTA